MSRPQVISNREVDRRLRVINKLGTDGFLNPEQLFNSRMLVLSKQKNIGLTNVKEVMSFPSLRDTTEKTMFGVIGTGRVMPARRV